MDNIAETHSTNADLLKKNLSILGEGYWLQADQQSGGRGRQGREWHSPEGNLYCSTFVRIGENDPAPASLAMMTSLSVYETVVHFIPDAEIRIKWPNDILVKKDSSWHKISGILLESKMPHIVIGIGMNVNIAPNLADRNTVCLKDFLHQECDVAAVLNILSLRFEFFLKKWRHLGLSKILDYWREYSFPAGTPMSTHLGNGDQIIGEFAGVTANGSLNLVLNDGRSHIIHAGDVMLVDQGN
ncbi:biotin--[acetyl-CoA-carboxylase] ligase [Sphingorhabdus lutea]|uniref:Biotin--[acetyl-CoA-carboxylase] ligase n=1 Tax=Sphingorhabdus lutea TaxID=1913578 RepID=A0A1L3JEX4_9SPHN|nr:biotin--[acetyl-CoA-carboxylase] ligase [Sphingorhabdus lutea]